MGCGLFVGPVIVVVLIAWVDNVGVVDVDGSAIEDSCALEAGACVLLLLLSLLGSLDFRVASAPPTPPPTAAATTTIATPTSIQNVLLRRPHIVCDAGCLYAGVVLSYAILFVSVGPPGYAGIGSGE